MQEATEARGLVRVYAKNARTILQREINVNDFICVNISSISRAKSKAATVLLAYLAEPIVR
jgi:hypothetical protein